MYTLGVIFDGLSEEEKDIVVDTMSEYLMIPVDKITEEDIYDCAINFIKKKCHANIQRKALIEAAANIVKHDGLSVKDLRKAKEEEETEEETEEENQ